MKKQPDDLFSKKLKGMHVPPPPSAWASIENNLSKKNNKVWLRYAAAAVLVIGVATLLVLNQSQSVKNDQISELTERKEPKAVDSTTVKQKESVTEKNVTPSGEKSGSKTKVSPNPKGKKAKTPKRNSAERTNEGVFQQGVASTNDSMTQSPQVVTDVPVNGDVLPTEEVVAINQEQVTQQRSSTVIVYNSAEVNEKYLDKNFTTEATPEQEKESTLKRLLDKAYDLKNNQDPLGQLRQKKNEILALNFKKEKQRNENR